MGDAHRVAMLAKHDAIVAATPDIERTGKTMPNTSANGYMFSLLDKDGELGIRLPKTSIADFEKAHMAGETSDFRSHGSVMRDYVRIPPDLMDEPSTLSRYLSDGLAYVMSLEPK